MAVDGKTLRGARRLGAHDVHLLCACCQQHALVLGQKAVPDETNELRAIGSFLARLPLAGETVTFDAVFTQWLVANQVVDQGGAYLMAVKANQPSLLRACSEVTAEHPKRPRRSLGQAHTSHLAHGRLEERTLLAVKAPPDLGFPYVRQVLGLHRRRIDKRTGEVLTDVTACAITSLGPEQASPQSCFACGSVIGGSKIANTVCGMSASARMPAPPTPGPLRRPSPPSAISPCPGSTSDQIAT
jgi:hypothetical protein